MVYDKKIIILVNIVSFLSFGWSQCDSGYTEIFGQCYFQADLDVLQDFIDTFEILSGDAALDIGTQQWSEGRLTSLNLSAEGLSGEIPWTVGNLSQLEFLGLSSNDLWGELPTSIGNLLNLTWITVYGNQLNGSIPTSITNLENLESLDLGINQFTGPIPGSIGNLTNLEYLYLDRNNLSDTIPESVSSLNNLTLLWLHENNLNGEIPVSICDLNVQWESSNIFRIFENMICPPYPECIEDYIGYQDTSECNQCSEITGDLNHDSEINILDIVIIANCILIAICDDCSDINGDGETNILDIVQLVGSILGN